MEEVQVVESWLVQLEDGTAYRVDRTDMRKDERDQL